MYVRIFAIIYLPNHSQWDSPLWVMGGKNVELVVFHLRLLDLHVHVVKENYQPELDKERIEVIDQRKKRH